MEFKVGDRVEFIENYSNRKKGDVVTVTGLWEIDAGKGIDFVDDKQRIGNCFERRVKLYTKKKTKNEHIAELEKQVAVIPELEKQVAELSLLKDRIGQLGKLVVEQLGKLVEVVEETQDVQRRTVQCAEAKSPNQLRKEIIERAKKFIQAHKDEQGYYNIKEFIQPFVCKADFIVDTEKRTVIALLRRKTSNKVRRLGIAICSPNDVFNEDIGKAIALGRALEIDVSEFENAVQPSHYAVGQIGISAIHDNGIKYRVDEIGEGSVFTTLYDGNKAYGDTTKPLNYKDECIVALKIIDDTNAEY